MYTVQTFVAQENDAATICEDEHGEDFSRWYEASFMGGFVLHAVNFVFFAFIDPLNRQVKNEKDR